jgi:hypothetical protein
MAQDTSRSSYNSKFAKAETLLALALLTDLLINPWLFSQPAITPAGKTLIKMALVIGLFGPVQSLVSRAIEGSLRATRTVTTSVLSLPRIGVHACILSVLFVCFYWSMHHDLPWSGAFSRESRQARVESR